MGVAQGQERGNHRGTVTKVTGGGGGEKESVRPPPRGTRGVLLQVWWEGDGVDDLDRLVEAAAAGVGEPGAGTTGRRAPPDLFQPPPMRAQLRPPSSRPFARTAQRRHRGLCTATRPGQQSSNGSGPSHKRDATAGGVGSPAQAAAAAASGQDNARAPHPPPYKTVHKSLFYRVRASNGAPLSLIGGWPTVFDSSLWEWVESANGTSQMPGFPAPRRPKLNLSVPQEQPTCAWSFSGDRTPL